MSFRTRLTIAVVALALTTAAAVGVMTYLNLESAILPAELGHLAAHAATISAELGDVVSAARSNVAGFAGGSALEGVVRSRVAGGRDPQGGIAESVWRERLARRFTTELSVNPHYLQFRLIGTADGGREIVRVERETPGGRVETVPPGKLQEKGTRPYFLETMTLPRGAVYVSEMELNEENGDVQLPRVPVIRTAIPVFTPEGERFGVVVINVDMRPLFARVRHAETRDASVYVLNARGEYLVNPDTTKEFGVRNGTAIRMIDEFPAFAGPLAIPSGFSGIINGEDGKEVGVAIRHTQPEGGPRITVVEVVPKDVLLTSVSAVRTSSLVGGGIAAVAAILLAAWLARNMTQPLVQMTSAVEAFPRNQPAGIPLHAQGEIGVLARAFERMRSEVGQKTAALVESEERFRQIAESLPQLVWTCTPDGQCDFLSTQWVTYTGIAAEGQLGSGWLAQVHQEDRALVVAAWNASLASQTDFQMEFRVRRHDGVYRWFDARGVPLRDALGATVKWFGSNTDVTERKLAEQARAQLARIVESSNDAIFTKTLDGTIISWNEGAHGVYGYSADEAIGMNVSLLTPPESRREVEQLLHEVGQGKNVNALEAERIRKDGIRIHVSLSIGPIRDAAGRIVAASTIARDITVRKRAEEALRRSEERLETVVENLTEGLVISDLNGQITHWNRAALAMHGYASLDECLLRLPEFEKTFELAAYNGSVLPLGQWPLPRIIRGEQLRNVEIRIRKFGTEWQRVFSYGGEIVVEPDGKQLAFVTITDITERKRAEEALQVSNERFRTVVRATNDAVWDWDLKTNLIWWNEGVTNLFGHVLEHNEVDAGWWEERIHSEDRMRVGVFLRQLMDGSGATWVDEYRFRRADGTFADVFDRGYLFRDAGGKAIRMIGAMMDVTGRREVEKALRSSETRLRAALTAGGMATWIWDVRHRGISWDELAATMLGGMPDGQKEWDGILPFIHPDDRDHARESIGHFLRGTDLEALMEFRIPGDEKGIRWLSIIGQLERDRDGAPLRMNGVITDITRRKLTEAAQLQSQKLEALGTLAGGIAHDFNNILTAIAGNARLAIADLPQDHAAMESLREIEKAGARAADIVHQILSFTRPEERRIEQIHLGPVVEEVVRLVRATLSTLIEIRLKISPDMPMIAADASQVHQIILNLATNAAHAIGNVAGVIEFDVDDVALTDDDARAGRDLVPGRYARLTVSDNGCGMDRTTLHRIFDPFFSTKPMGQGTGLGLSVVHGIMKSHHGAVTVYSQPGKGTSFRLYFPVAPVQTAPAHQAESQPIAGKGQHVLYVDDEEPLIILARRMLERLGYVVTGRVNPVEALQDFRTDPDAFDVVVTDLSMPTMSGFDLARAILAVRPGIPIVMTSGYVRPEDQAAARDVGIRELLLKPNTMEDLARLLDGLFSQV